VRWVHVIELAEAAHLLRGGELVLSTGIVLQRGILILFAQTAQERVNRSAPSGVRL
jgi:hypothetical protein